LRRGVHRSGEAVAKELGKLALPTAGMPPLAEPPETDETWGRGSGVNETYLEAGRRGKNAWWRYLLGLVFMFGAVVLGFEGSALKTPALFLTDRFVPAYSLIQFLATAALFYVAIFVLFKRRTKKGH
jgi:hypothetical protein